MTNKELMELMGVSRETVRFWITKGIPHVGETPTTMTFPEKECQQWFIDNKIIGYLNVKEIKEKYNLSQKQLTVWRNNGLPEEWSPIRKKKAIYNIVKLETWVEETNALSMFDEDPRMSTADICEMYNVTRATVSLWVKNGLRGEDTIHGFRFEHSEVRRWIESHKKSQNKLILIQGQVFISKHKDVDLVERYYSISELGKILSENKNDPKTIQHISNMLI